MAGLAAAWVVVAMLLAALVLQQLFNTNAERTVRTDMMASLTRLIALLDPEAEVPTVREPMADPLYALPLSGRYWQITALDNDKVARSRSLWDAVIDVPVPDIEMGDVLSTVEGPDSQLLSLLTRQVEIETSRGPRLYVLSIAENRQVLDEANVFFRRDMVLTLSVLGLAVVIVAWLQVKLGLSPLDDLRGEIEDVRQGDRMRLSADYPNELLPLVDEVNELLAVRDKTAEYARARASDLAHGLKTPLAALRHSAERLRQKGDVAEGDMLDDLAGEMSERIEYQLRLAALRIRSGTHVSTASLNAALIRTLMVLKKTERGESLHWKAELGADATIDMDRQDLLELVGILLENATKWASTRIDIIASERDGQAHVSISDDGPGIPEARLTELGRRGKRLDETRPGTGFGLAIAGEIVKLNNAELTFGVARTGGLEVTLRLPLARRRAG